MSSASFEKPVPLATGSNLFDTLGPYGRLRSAFRAHEKLLGYLKWLECQHSRPTDEPTHERAADSVGEPASESIDSTSEQRPPGGVLVLDRDGREPEFSPRITSAASTTLNGAFWIRLDGLPRGEPFGCRAFFLDSELLQQVRRMFRRWRDLDDDALVRKLFDRRHLESERQLPRILSALPDLDGITDTHGAATLELRVPPGSLNPLRFCRAVIVLDHAVEQHDASREYPHHLLGDFDFRPPRLETMGLSSPNPTLGSIHQLFCFLAYESAAHARQQLTEQLGALAESCGATAAALFRREAGERLNAFVLHNVRKSRLDCHLNDTLGIVPHVARERLGHCAPDVSKDELYREDGPETRSEIAVPVMDPTEPDVARQLLGVLNLECRDLNAFSPAQLSSLQAAAGAFVPHLRVLAALERQDEGWLPWHPEIHDWDLTRIFQKICHAVAASLGADTTKCSVWYVDRAKQEVFVYATNGYDIEYVRDRVLSMESCVGRCVDLPRGTVKAFDPLVAFVRREKAARMGLKAALMCPIYSPGGSAQRGGISVLSVYFTDPDRVRPEVHDAIRRLADVLGALAASFDIQRQRIAAAQLHHLLKEMPRSSESDFEVIRDFLKEVFKADGVSVFAREVERLYLQCVATTGLCKGSNRDSTVDPRRAGYPLDSRRGRRMGFTSTLALHPNVVLRMNNVLNRGENGLPTFLPSGPRLKYVENFAPREDKNRRLLAYGVAGEAKATMSNPEPTPCLGVIRILRRSGSKPFTQCDERLVARLSQVSSWAFDDWPGIPDTESNDRELGDAVRRFLRNTRARERSRARESIRALARTLRPIPSGRSTGTLIHELVRDMFTCYTAWDVRACGLFIRHGMPPQDSYRLHAYYAEPDFTSPLELLNHGMPAEDPYLLHQRALARAAGNDIHETPFALAFHTTIENGQPASGIRVPIRAWSRQHLIEAVMTLDFKGGCDWNQLLLDPLLYGVTRVAAIWSGSNANGDNRFRPPSPQGHRWNLRESASRLGDYLRQEFDVATEIVPAAEVRDEEWRGVAVEQDRDAALYGIRRHASQTRFALPLHIGPIPSAYVLLPQNAFSNTENLRPLCDSISAAWSQLLLGRTAPFGQCDLWRIGIQSQPGGDRPVHVFNCQFQWDER